MEKILEMNPEVSTKPEIEKGWVTGMNDIGDKTQIRWVCV